MIFATVIAVLLAVSIVFYIRDRRFEKKNIEDIAKPEMRKILNLPLPDDEFPIVLSEQRNKEKASRKMLREFNEM